MMLMDYLTSTLNVDEINYVKTNLCMFFFYHMVQIKYFLVVIKIDINNKSFKF